ncbi:hypothetical protein ACMFMG_011119 [Clarireedia jacksonii]
MRQCSPVSGPLTDAGRWIKNIGARTMCLGLQYAPRSTRPKMQKYSRCAPHTRNARRCPILEVRHEQLISPWFSSLSSPAVCSPGQLGKLECCASPYKKQDDGKHLATVNFSYLCNC